MVVRSGKLQKLFTCPRRETKASEYLNEAFDRLPSKSRNFPTEFWLKKFSGAVLCHLKTTAIIRASPICGAGAENTVSGQEVDTATVSAVSLRPKFSFGREGVAYP